MSVRRRWLAGAALVAVGWLASPQPVPVYDGVSAPDEPYRYVAATAGSSPAAAPTSSSISTPVKDGRGTNGLSVTTKETGPQFSLFLPPQSLAAASTITVVVEPSAPVDQPVGAKVDGNVYTVALTSASGPVTLTEKAGISTVYLRATTAKQPGPSLYFRATSADPWKVERTSRGGQDFYVGNFPGPGQYALAFAQAHSKGGGPPVVALVIIGVLVLLVVVVLVVRLRPPGGHSA